MKKNFSSKYYTTYHGLSHHEKIRYYNDSIKSMANISFDEWIDMSIDHSLVLFELGKYEKFLYLVDELIETVVKENIYTYGGKDVFKELLFRKAAANYNLEDYRQAETLVLQLIKIDEENTLYKLLYAKIINKKLFHTKKILRFSGVIMILASIIMKILDIFIVEPFYYQYHIGFNYTYLCLGIAGILTYVYDWYKYVFHKEQI
ncbi:MAG: hypothetical protein RLZZ546_2200 [Bacteroidota bacterium]|jgi:tetratricopeptide (TPR) repeat protein